MVGAVDGIHTEELLTQEQIDSLLKDSKSFLIDYTGDIDTAEQIYKQIVKSFFLSSLRTLEKAKDRRQVLADLVLSKIDEKLTTETDSISAAELSQIFKNIKKETR